MALAGLEDLGRVQRREATCLSPLCLSGMVGAVDSTAQRPSHSPWVQALPLPLPPTSIYPESLWYPALLSQPDLHDLIYSKPWEGRRQEGPLAKEYIHQLPQGQIPSTWYFYWTGRGGSDGVLWTGAQNPTGSDESPREMGGGTQLLQEVLLYGFTEQKSL